ncbi:hypothetical protein [Abyssalbus ytuae]|uniref:Aminoglycoside phosphotransferase domain-containing protein n=1 Tax=Abyssalbus ytuae TaxID=2926907 RepID=A0A9E6ZSG1_9FLAO|nr:hypothetical protein [Abyssalbus ytuae]UOB17023.1 hypothetical protein MQE35_14945 [Abyssalbus ytuae]
MRFVDYTTIIQLAWSKFNADKKISKIEDISAKVSTNHVFRVTFEKSGYIIAKLSYFGRHDYFKEDHKIINVLANNLLFPFDQFIARSLNKGNEIFTYRYERSGLDVWVVFYNPIRIDKKLPKILNEEQIIKLGSQLAHFHKACHDIVNELPASSKTMESDITDLQNILNEDKESRLKIYKKEILKQCDLFLENSGKLGYAGFEKLPVFIDWNIGNFSVDKDFNFYSRWDYDWFRMSPRTIDFYFWARVVRAEGDKTIFSYLIDPLMENRFIIFLKSYHKIFPLSKTEILFIKEAYRFFILHYVVRLGNYFFLNPYAEKLISEAFSIYLPNIDRYDPEKILTTLKL